MALNLVLFPNDLDEKMKKRIRKIYNKKSNYEKEDYHVSEYSKGALMRNFIDLKSIYNIRDMVCIAYKKDIQNAGRAVKWMKCGMSKENFKLVQLENKKQDFSKLERFLEG